MTVLDRQPERNRTWRPEGEPSQPRAAVVRAAPERRSALGARTAGVVAGVLLVGAGVVAAQEAIASWSLLGLRPQEGWIHQTLARLDGSSPGDVLYAIGGVAVLLGVVLLAVTWRSGPAPVRVASAPLLVLRPQDVARIASAWAEDVDGVLSASTTASRRSVVVSVRTTGDPDVPADVTAAVRRRLDLLEPAPRVRVRATAGGPS